MCRKLCFLMVVVSAKSDTDTAITTSLGPSSRTTNSMGRFQQHQKDLPGAACGQLIDAVPAQLEQHERSSSDYTTTSRRLYSSGLARLKAVDEGNLYTRAREKNGRNLSSTTSRALPQSRHRAMFMPGEDNLSSEEVLALVHRSQYPPSCDRYLVVVDPPSGMGLGWVSTLLLNMLATAMSENRVLIEVPHHALSERAETVAKSARWCDREPYTLQCLYMPWTDCPLPPGPWSAVAKWGRSAAMQRENANKSVVLLRVPDYHSRGNWGGTWRHWIKLPKYAQTLSRFITSPRPWVATAAACYMRECGLEPGQFLTVHLRESAEKQREARSELPQLENYTAATELVLANMTAAATGGSLLVQTANGDLLKRFTTWARKRDLSVCVTNNRRSAVGVAAHDSWGGKNHSAVMDEAAIAAVNGHLASLSGGFISPRSSQWTGFVDRLMGFGPDMSGCSRSMKCARRKEGF